MEWVIAILAVGCLFLTFQMVADYARHRALIAPRIRQLEQEADALRARIEAARGELEERRGQLEPAKGEIERLEQEYRDLQGQLEAERARQRGGLLFRRPPSRPRPQ
ncbi:MAG: hypothetical protein AB1505_07555 [Candidatus Latescibacterota bacterium]